MRILTALASLIVTGCSPPRELANIAIAKGPTASVKDAAKAARACGIATLRFDPLDSEKALLLIGKGNEGSAVDCTLTWIKTHWSEKHFEPIMNGTGQP